MLTLRCAWLPLALIGGASGLTGCAAVGVVGGGAAPEDADTGWPTLHRVGPGVAGLGGQPPQVGQPEVASPLAQVQVVVIGAGPAGLAAAHAALEAGAEVLVVERADAPGGAARWSGGLMTFAGSPEQAAAGLSDSAERFLADWPATTGGSAANPWVQRFAESGVDEVHGWLADRGAHFVVVPEADPGASVPRVHSLDGGGPALVDLLVQGLPDEALWLETEVVDLVVDASGAVRGVAVAEPEGNTELGWIAADAVVVASGGYLRDLGRVFAARPDLPLAELRWSCGPDADGAGHTLVESAGGVAHNLGAIGLYAHGFAHPLAPGEEVVFGPAAELLWVDLGGLRFVDETATNTAATAAAVLARHDGVAWAVFDAETADLLQLQAPLGSPEDPPVTLGDLAQAGLLYEADSLAALAEAIGVDADGLAETAEAWNGRVDDGLPDPWRGELDTTMRLDRAPYLAAQVHPVLAKVFGGMAVDSEGRLLGPGGVVLPGLYGAGELTGMMGGSVVGAAAEGGRGWTGSLSAVILSGRVAGAAAAAP